MLSTTAKSIRKSKRCSKKLSIQNEALTYLTFVKENKTTSLKSLGVAFNMSKQKLWHRSVACGIHTELLKMFAVNRNTTTVSVSKIRDPENSFHLDYDGTDFWKFYTKNRTTVDRIIDACLTPYTGRLNLRDAKQEILLRLHRCDALGNYNPELSRLNTWLTTLVGRYVQTLLKIEIKKPYWDPWPTQEVDDPMYDRHTLERINVPSINGMAVEKDDELPFELSSENDNIDDRITSRELVTLLKSKLTPEMNHMVDLLKEGVSIVDVANAFKTSPQFIAQKMSTIKRIAETIREKDLV
jgi:hypothetical protein